MVGKRGRGCSQGVGSCADRMLLKSKLRGTGQYLHRNYMLYWGEINQDHAYSNSGWFCHLKHKDITMIYFTSLDFKLETESKLLG